MAKRRDIPLLIGRDSHQGRVREKNEDFHGHQQIGSRQLFAVADGMGGEIGGQQASRNAVEAAIQFFESHPALDPPELLARAVRTANDRLVELQKADPELREMGTTLELVLVEDRSKIWWAHVGDSRIWLVSGGRPRQLTTDHTVVQQMLDGGLITEDQAFEHPKRHILSRVVGREPAPVPDVSSERIVLAEGDAIVMSTDGLADLTSAEEVAAIVSRYGPQRACERLVKLANQRGGHDNITVRAMYYGHESGAWTRVTGITQAKGRTRAGGRRRWIWWTAAASVALIVLTVIAIAGYQVRRWWLAPQSVASVSGSVPVAPTDAVSARGAVSDEPPTPAPATAGNELSGTRAATVAPEQASKAPAGAGADTPSAPSSNQPAAPAQPARGDSSAARSPGGTPPPTTAPSDPTRESGGNSDPLGRTWTFERDGVEVTWTRVPNKSEFRDGHSRTFKVEVLGDSTVRVTGPQSENYQGKISRDGKKIDGNERSGKKRAWHVIIRHER